MIVYARVIKEDHSVAVVFWSLLHIGDGCSETVVARLLGLFENSRVDTKQLAAWASDGDNAMMASARILQERTELAFMVVHCFCHRVDLAVSSGTWDQNPFCARVEDALRYCHFLFNRSAVRRKHFRNMEKEFGRILIPKALIDIRWLSKLDAIEAMVTSREALVQFIENLPFRKQSPATWATIETLREHESDIVKLLRMLRVVGKLTKKLQQRDIGLWGAKNLLDEAVSELQAITDLGDMVNPLCESLVKRLRERFPVNEAFWLNLMNVHLNYPSEVIKGKFINICTRVNGPGAAMNNDASAEQFAVDRSRLQKAILELTNDGATDIDIFQIAKSLNLSDAFWFYYDVVRVVVPTSVEAERGFSVLSRLRSRFRKRLVKHLPSLMSLSLSKSMGSGRSYLDDQFIRAVLNEWSQIQRRKRPIGNLRGPYGRRPQDMPQTIRALQPPEDVRPQRSTAEASRAAMLVAGASSSSNSSSRDSDSDFND